MSSLFAPSRFMKYWVPLLLFAATPGCTRTVLVGTTRELNLAPYQAFPATDSMPARESFTLLSAVLGEPRLINVYTPPLYRDSTRVNAPPLPVLYMPDGGVDEDFPHIARLVDSLIAARAIRPVIVVGVPNTERRRDLTGPSTVKSDSAIAPRIGGSANFRRFLRDELMPEISRRYRTTGERSIVGESLAGLFIVESFLMEPSLFTHYVALDPSVWWNGGAMIDGASARIAAFDKAPRTLFLATSHEPSTAVGSGKLADLLRKTSPPGLRFTYEQHPELEHSNIFRNLERAALLYSLR